MHTNKTSLSALLLVLGLFGAANAQEDGGFYVRGYGGLSTLNDTTVTIGAARSKGRCSSGAITGGAFGYDYGGPWRAEVEYTYRSSSLDRLGGASTTKGDYASTALMVNGLYSFSAIGRFEPYVGAGVGVTREVDFDVKGGASQGGYSASGSLAFQAIGGAEFELGSKWSGFAEVRVFGIDSPRLKNANRTLRADYRTVDVLLGVSRRF